jgi:predicted HD superfamily hydrolase involved in NAD metabolism
VDRLLTELSANVPLTGVVSRDTRAFLVYHHAPHTAGHCARVAAGARQLGERSGANAAAAEAAGWLHDISTVIPNNERIAYAEAWGIAVLPEEQQVPMIIHQKLSLYIAQHLFQITDQSILSAIGCHTTLRPQASLLDKVVFIADKLHWDGAGEPPYRAGLQAAVDCSIDAATSWFLSYLWERRSTLLVVHPWLAAAYAEVGAGNEPREPL